MQATQSALGDNHLPRDAPLKLPNAERAVVAPAKVRDYLLSPEHPVGRAKARFFATLGFRRAEWPDLRDALLAHARGEAERAGGGAHGQKYAVRGILQGPAGRSAPVVSVWIVLAGEEAPRLITAYPGEGP
jgi:hypothetical protein